MEDDKGATPKTDATKPVSSKSTEASRVKLAGLTIGSAAVAAALLFIKRK